MVKAYCIYFLLFTFLGINSKPLKENILVEQNLVEPLVKTSKKWKFTSYIYDQYKLFSAAFWLFKCPFTPEQKLYLANKHTIEFMSWICAKSDDKKQEETRECGLRFFDLSSKKALNNDSKPFTQLELTLIVYGPIYLDNNGTDLENLMPIEWLEKKLRNVLKSINDAYGSFKNPDESTRWY